MMRAYADDAGKTPADYAVRRESRYSEKKMMHAKKHIALMAALLCTLWGSGARAVTSSQTVTLTVNFTAPPCTVDINSGTNGMVDLGALPTGNSTRTPFNLTITCPYTRPSSLYATVQSGTVSGSTVNMLNGVEGGGAVTLTLSAGGTAIQYGSDGASNSAKQFCSGTTTRSCTITPITSVNSGVNGGIKTAVIIFTMVNP